MSLNGLDVDERWELSSVPLAPSALVRALAGRYSDMIPIARFEQPENTGNTGDQIAVTVGVFLCSSLTMARLLKPRSLF
jgi:hypothetical protein